MHIEGLGKILLCLEHIRLLERFPHMLPFEECLKPQARVSENNFLGLDVS